MGVLLEVRSDVSEIKGKLNTYNSFQEKVDDLCVCLKETDARSKSNTIRIDEIEESHKWFSRTVAGALIVTGIGLFVALIKSMA